MSACDLCHRRRATRHVRGMRICARCEGIDADARRAEAEKDDGLRCDGGNSHASRVAAQLAMGDEADDGEVALPDLHVGDHVQDRDSDDGERMLVVGTPIEAADEYECKGQTIAEYNPDYPADDAVFEVVYPQRTDVSTLPLDRYAFPRSRLELVAPIHDRDRDGDHDGAD